MSLRIEISNFESYGQSGILLAKRFRVRPLFYQKGSLNMMWAVFNDGAVAGDSVNQPNIVVSQSASGQQVQSGVRFQLDGGSDEIDKDGTAIARVSGEWWSAEPAANIGNDYDIRCASMVTGTWDFEAAAVGTWINIGSGQNWWMLRTFGKGGEGTGSDNAKGNFEIRDSATETTQATFTLEATATITA